MKTTLSLILMLLLSIGALAEETAATKLLRARSTELKPTITQVSPSVYCASGYSPANISMIIGDDGIVVIDTGMFPAHTETVLAEFRTITDLPVRAIVLTHGHGDHTGGVSVFREANGDGKRPVVYARAPFNSEGAHFDRAGVTINRKRGARQGGFLLPPEKRINNGIAAAVYPPKEQNVFATGFTEPDVTFTNERETIHVAGLTLELVAASGETDDQLYGWFPKEKVLFTGDNFYRSWPNLYAIRGTAYRDVQAWIDSLGRMLAEGPDHAVPGHTLPLVGREETTEVLSTYRDAINYVFQATIAGMNQGMTPDQLVQSVKLPEKWASKDYLREFYGNVAWSVRAIFSGHLGWFDGNPTNLLPLTPEEEAERLATLAGGPSELAAQASLALERDDARWCAQLCDHLLALDYETSETRLLKARALEAIAPHIVSGIGRNYYLTVAQELRKAAAE